MKPHTASDILHTKWQALADQARKDAETMPEGEAREGLLKQARQLDTAAQMNGWLSRTGFKTQSQ